MRKYTVLISLLAVALLSACGLPMRFTEVHGSGKLETEERRISGITSVELSGIGTLIIEQGDEEKLEITAEDNLMKYLETKTVGSNLSLGIQEFVDIHPTEDIIFHLSIKDLSGIETSGLGNVEVSKLETDDLWLEISGTGSMVIEDLQADSLDLEISGMGDVDLSGSVDYQDIEISGTGSYSAGNLFSDRTDIEISGTGDALVWTAKSLNLDMSGMGSLEYYGEPKISSDISGMGSLQSLGNK